MHRRKPAQKVKQSTNQTWLSRLAALGRKGTSRLRSSRYRTCMSQQVSAPSPPLRINFLFLRHFASYLFYCFFLFFFHYFPLSNAIAPDFSTPFRRRKGEGFKEGTLTESTQSTAPWQWKVGMLGLRGTYTHRSVIEVRYEHATHATHL